MTSPLTSCRFCLPPAAASVTLAYSSHAHRPLRDGDIVNIDVTAYLDGYHGDTNATFYVVSLSQQIERSAACREDLLGSHPASAAPTAHDRCVVGSCQRERLSSPSQRATSHTNCTQGEPRPNTQHLVETTCEALAAAIGICGPGVPFAAIGETIQVRPAPDQLHCLTGFDLRAITFQRC